MSIENRKVDIKCDQKLIGATCARQPNSNIYTENPL